MEKTEIIVDGQNIRWAMFTIVVSMGIDLRDLVSAAIYNGDITHPREVAITYRDSIKGDNLTECDAKSYRNLVAALKAQNIEILSIPDIPENRTQVDFNIDSWVKKDILWAIEKHPDLLIIISGDKHFSQLAAQARKTGIRVVAIGNHGGISNRLIRNTDAAFTFQEILNSFGKVLATRNYP